MSLTFFWHDYETWGADPRRDRACQFAGIRTDADLHEVGQPVVWYSRPADDVLPHPDACLITRITPRITQQKGVCEAEFAACIEAALATPGTCGVGYNSMRFDDEVTRHLLYRNLFDPYAREWRNGNSRWDLIDPLRLAHALRPEGLEWPTHPDGTTSFRLEALAPANGIEHGQAHDALADVRATIGMARRLRQAQPRLYDYALGLRDKRRVRDLLAQGRALLHVSARYPAALGCIAPVAVVAPHPGNPNGFVCFDLRADPALLLDLSAEEIRARLFTPDLPAEQRVPLKTVHANRAPVLAPMNTLTGYASERWQIDPAQVQAHHRRIQEAAAEIRARVEEVFGDSPGETTTDPDLMLYSGGFLSDRDRDTLTRLRQCTPAALASERPGFEDARLPLMLFRYRARNWPETLSPAEREEWDDYRLARLTDPEAGASIVLDTFEERIRELASERREDPGALQVLDDLSAWAEQIMDAGV